MILLTQFVFIFFFFNDTATTEIYTLSLHDALPICYLCGAYASDRLGRRLAFTLFAIGAGSLAYAYTLRSEEHTSELQSRLHLVCRLLLEKKKQTYTDRSGKKQAMQYFSHCPYYLIY